MISVICPVYNEEAYIAKCIDSILQQDYLDDMEVLFVDGLSTDRTRDIIADYSLKYPFIRLLDNPKRIVPYAMNIGIREAKGDVIIRLDAHAIYPTDYFSTLTTSLGQLSADNVGGVCRTLPAKNTSVCRAIAVVLSSSFGMGNSYFRTGASEIKKVDTVPFGCFRKDLFHKIGLFDEDLVRNQDDEFNGRIIKNGGTIYLLPSLVVDYYARDKVSKVARMFYQYGFFKPLVNKKLGAPATIRQFFPMLFVAGLILGAVLSIFSPVILGIYLSVIMLYVLLAIIFGLKDGRSIALLPALLWTYFTVHVSYGWGYWIGLYKLCFKRSFVARANR